MQTADISSVAQYAKRSHERFVLRLAVSGNVESYWTFRLCHSEYLSEHKERLGQMKHWSKRALVVCVNITALS